MKLCKNCQHFDNSKLLSECVRPMGISLVTDFPKFRKMSAETERSLDATGCGTNAKYFEIKELDVEEEEDCDDFDATPTFGRKRHHDTNDCEIYACRICHN